VAGIVHYTWRGGKGNEVPHRGLQHYLASKSRVDFVHRPWLEDRNVHDLKIRLGPGKRGRDQRIPAQARPDCISQLLKFRQGGDVIGKEGETSIHMVDELHPERGLLSECTIDGSHKSGEGVCQREDLQRDEDLLAGRASSGSVQPVFAAWHGREGSLMHSNNAIRVKVGQRSGKGYQRCCVMSRIRI
jgi:hypothetical protein